MFWYDDDSLPIRWRIVDSLTDDDFVLVFVYCARLDSVTTTCPSTNSRSGTNLARTLG